METRANYVMVGGFVLLLFFGLILSVLWLARFQGEAGTRDYDIFFEGSVAGLKTGSPVSYRGVTVGEVERIRIAPDNVERIQVTVSVDERTPVKTDTKASLELMGITGGVMVMLSGGTNAAPPLAAVSDRKRPVIAAQPSQLERLLEGAPALVESVGLLIRQAQDLLGEQNRAAFADTIRNLQVFTGVLAAQSPNIAATIEDAEATLASLRQSSEALGRLAGTLEKDLAQTIRTVNSATKNIDRTVGGVGGELEKVVAELRRTAGSATALMTELRTVVAENRRPIRDFTSTGLYELSAFINELRNLVAGLSRVTTEVRRDPARFIFGNQQEGYEAKQ